MFKQVVILCLIGTLTVSCISRKQQQRSNDELTMLIGTSADTIRGLYTFHFNMETGEATPLSEIKTPYPTYLTFSANNEFVYAVSEYGNKRSAVFAYAFDKEKGDLRLLNTEPTIGIDPCYITTVGKTVITANYTSGNISVFPLQEDGSLLPLSSLIPFQGSGAIKGRQDTPHIHCVHLTPDEKYLFATDLGTDKIHKFNINTDSLTFGEPEAFLLPAGSGPRHLTFTQDGKYAYLINELSGTVMAFTYADGMLDEIQTIAADTLNAQGSADIHISPDGKFLYASNRSKADGIAIFKIEANGTLTKAGYQLTGIHPRNFNITPNGKFLLVACRNSNTIQLFERDKDTGLLTDTERNIAIDKPMCIMFAKQ
ncbi:6-phosphogluconolactonase [termite gut metagenome]|uniref:6-phosphogluconolactonase n=1 Tax=termite gut metagenome TaxID=433724 RepID=A0A5J4RY38_9ZZZZ